MKGNYGNADSKDHPANQPSNSLGQIHLKVVNYEHEGRPDSSKDPDRKERKHLDDNESGRFFPLRPI